MVIVKEVASQVEGFEEHLTSLHSEFCVEMDGLHIEFQRLDPNKVAAGLSKISSLENSVQSLEGGVQDLVRRFDLLLQQQAYSAPLSAIDIAPPLVTSSRAVDKGKSAAFLTSSSMSVPELTSDPFPRKLELAIFYGENSDGWLFRAERYFEINGLLPAERLRAAVVCLEGDALAWYYWEDGRRSFRGWTEFKELLLERFRSTQEGNLREQLFSLHQSSTVKEYRRQFEVLSTPLRDLSVISPNKRKCFRLIENSSYWDESESRCRDYNGHLATLTSAKELSFAGKLCTNTARGCWVGGRGFNSTGGFSWKWSDNATHWNESISPGAPFHSNGSNSSCKGINLINTCTSVTNGQPTLVGERCNNSHEFICMLDIENKCYHLCRHKEYLIILATVSGMILCTTLAVVIWLLAYGRSKRRRRSRRASNPSTSASVTPSWKVFNNEELRPITKNFSEGNRLVGNAKTGGTYSGLLSDGTRVAVKRLKRSSFQRKKEFYSGTERVAKLHYPTAVHGVRPSTMPGVTSWKCLFIGRTCLILKIHGSLLTYFVTNFLISTLRTRLDFERRVMIDPQLILRMPGKGKVSFRPRGEIIEHVGTYGWRE